jgi:tripartite-type tricarboxylate transporter receptor subunit TctC
MRLHLRTIVALAATVAGLATAHTATAQTYPTKPVKLVLGFSPGGSADALARMVAQKLSESLGQPVVVENRTGASGTIGAASVAKAPADGYTLLFVTSGHAGNATLFPKLPYDTLKDLMPIASIATVSNVVVVNSQSKYWKLGDLVADLRARPGQLNYAAAGGGATLPNLAADVFRNETKTNFQLVPYKGSGPALAALMGGEVDFAFDTVPGVHAHIRGGKLRSLAVTTIKRSAAMPEVPTIAEEAVPGFDVVGWFGMVAPTGTPRPIIEQLNKSLVQILRAPEMRERLMSMGFEPFIGTPDEFGTLVASEVARWGEVIRRLGLKPDQ